MHLATIGDVCNIFDLCIIPEIIEIVGYKLDLQKHNYTAEVWTTNLSYEEEQMIEFFCGKSFKRKWSIAEILTHPSGKEIVEKFFSMQDDFLDSIRIDYSPKSIAAAIKVVRISKRTIISSLLSGLHGDPLDELHRYLNVKGNSRYEKNQKATYIISRMPEKRIYMALHQVIKAGLDHG